MKKLIVIAALIVPMATHAEWVQVSKKSYFDPESATRSGNIVTYWSLMNFDKGKLPDARVASQKTRSNIDCVKKFETVDWVIMYDKPMGGGKVLANQAVAMAGQPIPPGTVIAEEMDYLCK